MEKLSEAEREMLEGATVDASKGKPKKGDYTLEQQEVIDAFEKVASQDKAHRAIVENIKSHGIFEGRGDSFEQIFASIKNLKKTGVPPDELQAALNKQVGQMLTRYGKTIGPAA